MASVIRRRNSSRDAPGWVLNNSNNNTNKGTANRKRKRVNSMTDESTSHSTDGEDVVATKKVKAKMYGRPYNPSKADLSTVIHHQSSPVF
jgi:hypothetical protein